MTVTWLFKQFTYHSEEIEKKANGSCPRNKLVNLSVLIISQQWVLAPDPTSLHSLIECLSVVSWHQRALTLTSCIEFEFSNIILKRQITDIVSDKQRGERHEGKHTAMSILITCVHRTWLNKG
jgi:hypothetical protein